MSSPIEIHDIGSIGDDAGKIWASYTPQNGSVTLHVSVPSDRRRADIVVRVGTAALRRLVDQLDAAVELAKRKKTEVDSLSFESDGVSLTVMNARLFVPKKIFEKLSDLIDAGNNDAVLREIKINFPLLTETAVSELAIVIYKHLRPRA
ncbi:MAG TPA: hypothetical protein VHO91_12895 [Rhodopila sp.]|nr:hypothetical protein [Rhodopila sp.]